MKPKNTILTIAVLMTAILCCNCSKKSIATYSDNETQNKIYSHQLEMDYPSSENTLSASADESAIMVLPAEEARFEAKSEIKETKKERINRMVYSKVEKLQSNKLFNKIVTKRVEKLMKKQNAASENEVTGKVRTGIIIGAVGLLLLILAGFFGSAAGVMYAVGAVLFVVGVVLILLGVL